MKSLTNLEFVILNRDFFLDCLIYSSAHGILTLKSVSVKVIQFDVFITLLQ